MPRKKKQQEQLIEQKKKESSSIGYNGVVNINVIRKGKVIKRIESKNSGNEAMFYFLAKCLQGSYEESLRPKYIHLFHKENDTETLLTSIATPCSRSFLVNDNGWGASLEFLIPAIYITENADVNLLRLYNSLNTTTVENYSAEVNLASDDTFSITSNKADTSILITWTLYITNLQSVASE